MVCVPGDCKKGNAPLRAAHALYLMRIITRKASHCTFTYVFMCVLLHLVYSAHEMRGWLVGPRD